VLTDVHDLAINFGYINIYSLLELSSVRVLQKKCSCFFFIVDYVPYIYVYSLIINDFHTINHLELSYGHRTKFSADSRILREKSKEKICVSNSCHHLVSWSYSILIGSTKTDDFFSRCRINQKSNFVEIFCDKVTFFANMLS
jgi:hypothetical protein